MTDHDLERLADLVASRIPQAEPLPRIVDAAGLADYLGVSRDVVYANADRLGAIRLGDGARPRLRFVLDAETVRAWAGRPELPSTAVPRSSPPVELLPVREAA